MIDNYAAGWRAAMTMARDLLDAIDEPTAARALRDSGLSEPLPTLVGEPLTSPVYVVHGDWAVTGYGIEKTDGTYAIEEDRLDETRDGWSDWILHMGEKEWCNLPDFCVIFRKALEIHKVSAHLDVDGSMQHALRSRW